MSEPPYAFSLEGSTNIRSVCYLPFTFSRTSGSTLQLFQLSRAYDSPPGNYGSHSLKSFIRLSCEVV